jgi:uncharacterized OB-fold protein
MTGLAVCLSCGRAAFPRPLWCPVCGADEWSEEELGAGRVEETTLVRRAPGRVLDPPSRLGTVRLDAGPPIVVRLAAGASAGSRVWVELDGGAPVARPIRPPGRRPARS